MIPSIPPRHQQHSSVPIRDDTRPSSQRRPPPPPPPIGKGQKPGAAAEGSVLQSIETAVEKHVKAKPSISLRDMHDIVKAFAVVRTDGRDICLYYLDECIRHFGLASDDDSCSGRSAAASIEHTEGRSAVPSRKGSQRTPPTSTEREQPSTLALDDLTNVIEIMLPNDVSKPVTSAFRNGDRSYISPRILDRCNLNVVGTNPQVLLELRWRIEDNNRVRSYRVPNCSFRVRDGLKTDLAMGSRVLEQLEKQAGSTEDSWDLNESTDDEAFENSHRRSVSGDAKTSSHAGSSTVSSGGHATSKDYLALVNRLLDMDLGARNVDNVAYGNRRNDQDDSHTMSPERPGRSRHR